MDRNWASLDEGVKLVNSGCMLALGGLTIYRRPMAFVKSLLRHYHKTGEPNNLTLLAFTAGLECDLLVGAGMVSRVRTCYFGLEIFGFAPMFAYYASRGEIEVIEETEASLSFGLRAKMAGVGFMPGRGWLGTDLQALRPDLQTIQDPYSGEKLMAFPAIQPDISVIHALSVDNDGNALIGGNKGVDEELVLASKKVVLTVEERATRIPKVDIIAPLVDTLISAPGGAKPTSCHPLYPLDGEKLLSYVEQVSDPSSFQIYLDNWLGEEK